MGGLTQTLSRLGEHLAKTAVIVERTFDAPVATVWKVITEKDQMKQWFFETLDSFKPEVGFQTIVTVRQQREGIPSSLESRWSSTRKEISVCVELYELPREFPGYD